MHVSDRKHNIRGDKCKYLKLHCSSLFWHPSHQYPEPMLSVTFLLHVLQARYHIAWSGFMKLIYPLRLKNAGCSKQHERPQVRLVIQQPFKLARVTILC